MKQNPAAWVLLLISLPALPLGARAEVFLSPGLKAKVGYTSNRFQDPAAQGTAFTDLTPSLELTAFLPGSSELLWEARHHRTDYLESGFGHREDTSTELTAIVPAGKLRGSLGLGAGIYRDTELPEDDSRWAAVSPAVSWPASPLVNLFLGGSVLFTRYDSRQALSGSDQRDRLWSLQPGIVWTPAKGWRLWGQAEGEANRSNEPIEEYDAGGGAAGFDAVLGGAARAGGWVRYHVLTYRDSAGEGRERRRDKPFSSGVWAAYRLTPWAEVTAEASRVAHWSTDDANDYTVWNVEGGLRFVYDWAVSKR